jgi:hypothetical protein
LLQRWRQHISPYTRSIARFAKLIAEYQIEPAFWTSFFPLFEKAPSEILSERIVAEINDDAKKNDPQRID